MNAREKLNQPAALTARVRVMRYLTHPEYQNRVKADLDRALGGQDSEENPDGEKALKALGVILLNRKTATLLAEYDPQAILQALTALGLEVP